MNVEVVDKLRKGTGWKTVYETLHAEILSLELPPGTHLDETSLAERFGLSRSPVREALIRLAGDELVVMLSNRSTLVAPIDIGSFPRYVEALDIAQRIVTRLAAMHRTKSDIALMSRRQREFEATVKTGDYLAMSEANKKFHMAIAVAGRNPYLANFYERLLTQGRRMLHMHFEFLKEPTRGYLLTDEHNAIIDAIREGDVELADKLAHLHTRQFQDQFVEFLRENYVTNVSLNILSHQSQ